MRSHWKLIILWMTLCIIPSSGFAQSFHYVILADAHGYVYVDIGKQQGIHPGMRFQVTRGGSEIGYIVIQAVDDRFARATVQSGQGFLPGDEIVLVPSSSPLAIAPEPSIPRTTSSEQKPSFSWFSLGTLLSVVSAAGSFYLAHHASENYIAAETVDEVGHYAQQRDRYQKAGWTSVGTGVLLMGIQWLRSHL